jgi:C-terminal processing protease CtpA/Prc
MTGDAILAIDGVPIEELGSLGAAVQRIRGAEGTVAVFSIRRALDGREQEVRVTRALVRGP